MPKTVEEYAALAAAQAEHQRITKEVFRETDAQLTKWGVQDHPMGTGPNTVPFARTGFNLDLRYGKHLADRFRDACEQAFKEGRGTYWDILLEEVGEAVAEEPGPALEKELIQVAAVAVSMVAASRRARNA